MLLDRCTAPSATFTLQSLTEGKLAVKNTFSRWEVPLIGSVGGERKLALLELMVLRWHTLGLIIQIWPAGTPARSIAVIPPQPTEGLSAPRGEGSVISIDGGPPVLLTSEAPVGLIKTQALAPLAISKSAKQHWG